MKLQIVSDLHLEFYPGRRPDAPDYTGITPAPGADVLVLAGDIGVYERGGGVERFRDWPVPVIYIAGNHEFYRSWDMTKTNHGLRALCDASGIHYLEQDALILPGHPKVRFLGTCLWTDYLLFGKEKQAVAMYQCGADLNDHRTIRLKGKPFTPQLARETHARSKSWLREQMETPFAGKTVVITHHGCSMGSVAERWKDDLVSAGFSSDLTLLAEQADAWIHGHTHDSHRYSLGKCQVVVNPRGYPLRQGGVENDEFDPLLTVEV